MASVRNNDRILDAAREAILGVGWRRATLTEVARRAGLSRMTVYRAYPDMQSILADLMTREWVAQIDEIVDDAAETAETLAETLARRFVAAVAALRDNALFHRIVDVDPEQLLPYLFDRRGRAQDAILELLADRFAAGQAGGEVRAGNPRLLARSVMLAAHGFALSFDTMVGDDVTAADLDGELLALVRGYLAP